MMNDSCTDMFRWSLYFVSLAHACIVYSGCGRARMAFEILRATNLCIRGRRKKWRSAIGMDDGAGLHVPLSIG